MDSMPPLEDDDGRSIAMDGQAFQAPAASALAAQGHGLAAAPGGLGEVPTGLAAAADGHVQPTDATAALALARTLLPTVPPAAIEYNLPVLDVQRSQIDDVENIERVDWATIQIVETHDDEGRIDLMSESQMCELLGLTDEVITNIPAQGFDCRMDEEGNDKESTDGAAIPTSDAVPCEIVISYDKNNPSMEVGTLYPTMDEFKLAVRQFAINNEFNLGVEKSCKTRYRAFCKSGDENCPCPWRINGTKHKGQATVEVTVLVDKHECVSSMRQINTTPNCKWVASKAVSILRDDPHIGARELQIKDVGERSQVSNCI